MGASKEGSHSHDHCNPTGPSKPMKGRRLGPSKPGPAYPTGPSKPGPASIAREREEAELEQARRQELDALTAEVRHMGCRAWLPRWEESPQGGGGGAWGGAGCCEG